MRNPEAIQPVSTFPEFLDKIVFNYNGNFSRQIVPNTEPLRHIHRIIGVPKKSLIITDGGETPEIVEMHVASLHEVIPVKQIKRVFEIENTKESVVLKINSRVIDGKIQDGQRELGGKNEVIGYKDIFGMYLKYVLAKGISAWALGELDKFPVWKRVLKRAQVKTIIFLKQDSLIKLANIL